MLLEHCDNAVIERAVWRDSMHSRCPTRLGHTQACAAKILSSVRL